MGERLPRVLHGQRRQGTRCCCLRSNSNNTDVLNVVDWQQQQQHAEQHVLPAVSTSCSVNEYG